MVFEKFHYRNLEQIKDEVQSMNLNLHFSDQLALLGTPRKIGNFTIPNSLAFHPMEGCDGTLDGSPDELTFRRYKRFAKGGAGTIWFEAVSVVPEGRANSRQLWIHNENLATFQRLFQCILEDAQHEYGKDYMPLCIMQLTHSGRFSRPEGKPAPLIATHNPYLDTKFKVGEEVPVVEDNYLEQLEDRYVEAAVLAQKAGFHGVDIKACHRYLNSELLSAYTRKGRYGETFEGRTRFLLNVIDKVKNRLGNDFIVTTRLNIYDGIPYPYGWGVNSQEGLQYDATEPLRLIRILAQDGIKIINLTMGTPYYNPHVNRPYDKGGYIPEEHPLEGIERLVNGMAEVQRENPAMLVIGTGYSWLRQFSPYLAAGSIEKGYASIIGYGRESFAYPDFAKDILQKTGMQKDKCCISCGKCSEIMKAGGTAGCVIRDAKVYGPIYQKYCKKT